MTIQGGGGLKPERKTPRVIQKKPDDQIEGAKKKGKNKERDATKNNKDYQNRDLMRKWGTKLQGKRKKTTEEANKG